MNENDARVIRTRQQLRDAFIELVIERGYDDLTIMDIVQHAKVGHKTFYRHFSDKQALLYTIMGEILGDMQALLLPPGVPNAPEENTINALRFAHRYARPLRVILLSPAAQQLVQPLIDFGMSEGQRFFAGSDIPDEVVAYHFTTSLISLIRWWLEHDMPFPPEQMAAYVNRLVIQPISQLRDEK